MAVLTCACCDAKPTLSQDMIVRVTSASLHDHVKAMGREGGLNNTARTLAQGDDPIVACLLSCSQNQLIAITCYTHPLGWCICITTLPGTLDTFSCCPCRLSNLRSKRVAHQEGEAVPLQSGQPGANPAHPPGGRDPCNHPSHLCLPTPQTS